MIVPRRDLRRPVVEFDPALRQHRQWLYQFEQLGSWRQCPVRFELRPEHGDLVNQCRIDLSLWYLGREFSAPG